VVGCTSDGGGGQGLLQTVALQTVAPRGPTIAFESIDGPPAAIFQRLVGDLAAEADSRQMQVVSRSSPAAFRVRGYLAANVVRGRTHFDWAWDVYDSGKRRAFRIAGEEPGGGKSPDVWASLDDQTLSRIARASMDRLAGFLGSPDVATARAFAEEIDVGPAFAGADPPVPRARPAVP